MNFKLRKNILGQKRGLNCDQLQKYLRAIFDSPLVISGEYIILCQEYARVNNLDGHQIHIRKPLGISQLLIDTSDKN